MPQPPREINQDYRYTFITKQYEAGRWTAHWDNTDGSFIGWGSTEKEAVLDLVVHYPIPWHDQE